MTLKYDTSCPPRQLSKPYKRRINSSSRTQTRQLAKTLRPEMSFFAQKFSNILDPYIATFIKNNAHVKENIQTTIWKDAWVEICLANNLTQHTSIQQIHKMNLLIPQTSYRDSAKQTRVNINQGRLGQRIFQLYRKINLTSLPHLCQSVHTTCR